MQDWEKTNYEAYSELNHSQDDELMHWGVKGMSWKKGAEYLKEGGRLVNGVIVYANGQAKKAASAIDKATGGAAGRARTVQNGKAALKKAFKATGRAVDKGAYKVGNAMAKAVNSKQTAKVAAKLKAKLSKKKVVEVADKVAKNLNSKGAKQFRKDLAYKLNNTYRNKVDAKAALKRKETADAAAKRKAEARRKAEQERAAKEAAARKAAEDARKREEAQKQALRDRDAKIKAEAESKRKAEEDAKKAAAKKEADALEAGKQGLKNRQKEEDFRRNALNNTKVKNEVTGLAMSVLGKDYGTKFRNSTYEKIVRDSYDEKTGQVDMRKVRDYLMTVKKTN